MTWTYDLIKLIRASGGSGNPGQSFMYNVAGADHGARVTDYFMKNWSFSGEPVPEMVYNEGQGFTISIDFSQGIRAGWIKRTGSGVLLIEPGLSPNGFDIYNKSGLIAADSSGSYGSLNIHAPYNGTVAFTGTSWFQDYIKPDYPHDNNSYVVQFKGVILTGGASGEDNCSFYFRFNPDIGPFNSQLVHEFPLRVNRRSYPSDPTLYYWEWHAASDYSDAPVSTSAYYTGISSGPGDQFTLYLRGRRQPSDGWTEVGAITFVDPRNAF